MKNMTRFAIGALAFVPAVGFAQTLLPSQDAYYVPGNGTNFGQRDKVTYSPSFSLAHGRLLPSIET